MPKTIVILLDGTSNEIARNRTHILRLYGCLKKDDAQLVYYDPGVGTFGAENAWSATWRKAHEVWGLATGWGLDQNVKEAYRFLIKHYSHGDKAAGTEPDRIVLGGFSRGAYTARVLAGFLHALGLMAPENENLVDYAYRAYRRVSDDDSDSGDKAPGHNPFAAVRLFDRMLRAPRVAIDVMMLFDTVGSVIEWKRGPDVRRYAFTARNPSVRAVRHALAIDERRTMFTPQLWAMGGEFWGRSPVRPQEPDPQDVSEVWFSGVHGDIGGGYPEDKSALGKLALEWMLEETAPLGLRYKTRTINRIVKGQGDGDGYVAPSALAEKNSSMTPGWRLLEYWPRRRRDENGHKVAGLGGLYLGRSRRRVIPDGAQIHRSVFERRGTAADYDQPNIPKDHVRV